MCVSVNSGVPVGLWQPRACSGTFQYICKKLKIGYSTPVPPPTSPRPPCMTGWPELNGFCYKVSKKLKIGCYTLVAPPTSPRPPCMTGWPELNGFCYKVSKKLKIGCYTLVAPPTSPRPPCMTGRTYVILFSTKEDSPQPQSACLELQDLI